MINTFKRMVFVIILMVIVVSACSMRKDMAKDQLSGNSKDENIENNVNNTEQIKAMETDSLYYIKSLERTSNHIEHFKKQVELGYYTEIIRLGGKQRDSNDIIINADKIILPEGRVVTITSETHGTRAAFVNISEEKVIKLISEIENSKIVDPKSVNWRFPDTLGVSIRILLINTDGEYIQFRIHLNSKNNHETRILYETENLDTVYLQSEELTEIIKELSGWKFISNKDLEDIVKVKYRDISYDENKEFELTPNEIKVLVEAISNSTLKPKEYPCPCNIVIEAFRSNGEMINMIWSESGEGMAIEGAHYQLNRYQDVAAINKILTKYSRK